MQPELHERAIRIVGEAAELEGEERERFLRETCAESPELLREVRSLLGFHVAGDELTLGQARGRLLEPASRSGFRDSAWAPTSRFFGSPRRQALSVVVIAVLIALVGYWAQSQIHRSFQSVLGEQLRTVVRAEDVTLERWVERRFEDLEALVADPTAHTLMMDLLVAAAEPFDADAVFASPSREELEELFRRRITWAAASLTDSRGRMISEPEREWMGIRPYGVGMELVQTALAGERAFTPPVRPGEYFRHMAESPTRWSLLAVPVRDSAGTVRGVLAVGEAAAGELSELLQAARIGGTGEAYAFDANGRMLSVSRYAGLLRAAGVLADTSWGGILDLEVRDPGGDLLERHEPSLVQALRPLTELAAQATRSARATPNVPLEGVILDPYRNYRGADVIGAWRWLPEKRFGIAVEMERSEAYAPLRYLDGVFAVLFVILVLAVAWSLMSTFEVVKLRRKVDRETRLGPYTLERKIDEGGMGEVFLAGHGLLARPAAVKVLRPELHGPEMVARFEREVQLASRLSHPNTVQIFDYGRTESGVFYYAMEYVDGIDLEDLVRLEGAQPPGRVTRIIRQVARSLREAHDIGLVHRDIKPSNIMLTHRPSEWDVAKVLDFGMAKEMAGPGRQDLTQTEQLGGTPRYMAPERIRGQHADARSDIYSLGAVGHYLLTARVLFDGKSPLDLLVRVASEIPPRPSEHSAAAIPEPLDRLIMDCLAKDPDQRPQSVTDVLDRLDGIPSVGWSREQARSWWMRWQSSRPSRRAGRSDTREAVLVD